MRGREHQDERLEEFIAGRTQDLHHDAYQLTAAQQPAERLVTTVLADMRRERVDLAQAGADARLRMARAAARHDAPTETTDVSQLPARFQVLARLSPRQRAVLLAQVVDNYDERETARALGLTTRAVSDTLRSIPYDQLPGASPHSGELRSLLEEFGDLAVPPDAITTLADVHDTPPPARRPWWTYVATLLVIALTIASLVITQRWHDDWLHSPEGLNHAHGTHFPAYTQGYKLVGIQDVKPGPVTEIPVGTDAAVTVDCHDLGPGLAAAISSELDGGTYLQRSCPGSFAAVDLVPAVGNALVSINDFTRSRWPVAVYRQIPLSRYPVATSNFEVQRSLTLAGQRRLGDDIPPTAEGTVLTMRGTAERPNGTFTGTLRLPAAMVDTNLYVVGLLSPTTTGRYRIRVDDRVPWMSCGDRGRLGHVASRTGSCSLVDHRIPQVTFNQMGESSAGLRTMPIEITVEDARGPWKLQVVADRYKLDAGAVDDGANG